MVSRMVALLSELGRPVLVLLLPVDVFSPAPSVRLRVLFLQSLESLFKEFGLLIVAI